MSVILVIVALVILDISKGQLIKQLTWLIHRLGGGQRGLIITWSIIFLPGTIIHEISHFLVAALTGARTGKIEIFPEYLDDENGNHQKGVVLGYVQTQTLNPIQGFLVGTAPFVSGIVLLIFLSSLIQTSYANREYQLLLLQGYFFFTIANSFFPSWSDIKQTLPLVVMSVILFAVAWILGFQVFYNPSLELLSQIDSLNIALLSSTLVNLFVILILLFFNSLLKRKR